LNNGGVPNKQRIQKKGDAGNEEVRIHSSHDVGPYATNPCLLASQYPDVDLGTA
jgi:hypothetical protein